jgi:DNA-binding MarR family transcriptional regulator
MDWYGVVESSSSMPKKRTPRAEKLTEVIVEVLCLRGSLERCGTRLTRPFGQTPARRQVLAAIWGDSRTVPQNARRMGLSRQGVQRIADLLVKEGLAGFVDNIGHRSSPILQLSDEGILTIEGINQAQIEWSHKLGRKLNLHDLEITLQGLCAILDDSSD